MRLFRDQQQCGFFEINSNVAFSRPQQALAWLELFVGYEVSVRFPPLSQ
jgi:hypothetical protein